MQHLFRPRVLLSASIAAAISALACYPRLALWSNQPRPVWYLVSVIFLCCIILWGFVFAWHTQYAHCPVFVRRPEPKLFIIVTGLGLGTAAGLHFWLDPLLRPLLPEDYPADLKHWLATVLFSLALTQLFLVFAPFVWLMRQIKHRWVATSLTALLGTIVMGMKLSSLPTPVPLLLLTGLLIGRLAMGFLVVSFYLRGGVVLVWWWTLLCEARHLVDFL